MQRRRGAVKADIANCLAFGGEGIEASHIGALVDEATLLKHGQKIGSRCEIGHDAQVS
jgi:hypothetical protein